jgi:putative copper resistance protein D
LLRRNATLEIALGIGVIAIVGALGILVPATHQPATWPFDRTLSLEPIQQSAWMQVVVSVLGTIAFIAAITLLVGALGRPPRIRIVAVAGFVIPVLVMAFLLAVPAYPTTYLASPVPYAAEAIATGSALYAENCSVCHGRNGDGAGQDEPAPSNPRLNLNSRVPEHAEGNLFWWIAHGVPGTPMPGFSAQLSDLEIWSLVQFLDAQVAAQNALALSDGLKPVRPVPAPDFSYEFVGRPQESLRQQRGSRVVLLVFYTLPSSFLRLRELAALEPGYTALEQPSSRFRCLSVRQRFPTGDDDRCSRSSSPVVASTYMMFARQEANVDAGALAHVEYLVDRFGYIRVRHIGLPKATSAELAQTLRRIELLVTEPPRTALQWGHRHWKRGGR